MTDQEWLQIFCKGGFRGTKAVVGRLTDEVAALKAERDALREALEIVEFDRHGMCLWCARWSHQGHNIHCPRQLALKGKEE